MYKIPVSVCRSCSDIVVLLKMSFMFSCNLCKAASSQQWFCLRYCDNVHQWNSDYMWQGLWTFWFRRSQVRSKWYLERKEGKLCTWVLVDSVPFLQYLCRNYFADVPSIKNMLNAAISKLMGLLLFWLVNNNKHLILSLFTQEIP